MDEQDEGSLINFKDEEDSKWQILLFAKFHVNVKKDLKFGCVQCSERSLLKNQTSYRDTRVVKI